MKLMGGSLQHTLARRDRLLAAGLGHRRQLIRRVRRMRETCRRSLGSWPGIAAAFAFGVAVARMRHRRISAEQQIAHEPERSGPLQASTEGASFKGLAWRLAVTVAARMAAEQLAPAFHQGGPRRAAADGGHPTLPTGHQPAGPARDAGIGGCCPQRSS